MKAIETIINIAIIICANFRKNGIKMDKFYNTLDYIIADQKKYLSSCKAKLWGTAYGVIDISLVLSAVGFIAFNAQIPLSPIRMG